MKKHMTETEWNACCEPEDMLVEMLPKDATTIERKLRLWGVACCRRIWDLIIDHRSRKAVDIAEIQADGPVNEKKLLRIASAAYAAAIAESAYNSDTYAYPEWAALSIIGVLDGNGKRLRTRPPFDFGNASLNAARARATWKKKRIPVKNWSPVFDPDFDEERAIQAELLRDIFGFPFGKKPVLDPTVLEWNKGEIVIEAKKIYEGKHFEKLPQIAKLLEKAGCSNKKIIDHCRSKSLHVRGCWVIDLILGQS
jgi:hypothetical protein